MYKVEIKVTGQIDEQWSEWLGGLDVYHSEPNQTTLRGYVTDQAALYGIIARLRDLGLRLNSIHNEDVDKEDSSNSSKGAENE